MLFKKKKQAQEASQKPAFYDPKRAIHSILPCLFVAAAVLVGFFLVLDMLGKNDSVLGAWLVKVLRGLFSHASYAIPVLLLWQGVRWRGDVRLERGIARGVYYTLFLVTYGAFYFYLTPAREEISFSISAFFRGGVMLDGPGLLGGSVGYLLCRLTGFIGVPFAAAVILLLFLVHFLKLSPYHIKEKMREKGDSQSEAQAPEEGAPLPLREESENVEEPAVPTPEVTTSKPLSRREKRALRDAAREEKRRAEQDARDQAARRAQEEDGYFPPAEEETFEQIRDRLTAEASQMAGMRQMQEDAYTPAYTPAQETDDYYGDDVTAATDPYAQAYTQPHAQEGHDTARSADAVFGNFDPLAMGALIDGTPAILRPVGAPPVSGGQSPLTTQRPAGGRMTPAQATTAHVNRDDYHAVEGGVQGPSGAVGSYLIHAEPRRTNVPAQADPQVPAPASTPSLSDFESLTVRDELPTPVNNLPYVHPATQPASQEQIPMTGAIGQAQSTPTYSYEAPAATSAPTYQGATAMPHEAPVQAEVPYAQPTPTYQESAPAQVPMPVPDAPANNTPAHTSAYTSTPAPQKAPTQMPTHPSAPAHTEAHTSAPAPATPYRFPPMSLLKRTVPIVSDGSETEVEELSDLLVSAFQKFRFAVEVKQVMVGPRITRFCISPPDGVRIQQLMNLSNDIALSLAVESVRINPVPNTPYLGVEIPNRTPTTVRLSSLIDTSEFKNGETVTRVPLGSTVTGGAQYADIAEMPHCLIAGATGMGKSVLMNSILVSLLYRARPDEVKMILIDPKRVELSVYSGIPHLLIPPVVEPQKAAGALIWAVGEMERRYSLMEKTGTRNIAGYNRAVKADPSLGEVQPTIIIVIDELNDLMMQVRDAVEPAIARIAQKARAAGIHLIIGTQRPSVDVITGVIKANIPTRIALHVSSGTDSRTILDTVGAEKLLDKGDALASIKGREPVRMQSAFVTDEEVENVVTFLKQNSAGNTYDEIISAQIESETERYKNAGKRTVERDEDDEADGDIFEDSRFMEACQVAFASGNISTSLLQRRIGLGYGKAAKYIDQMEMLGIVGPPNGTKPRELLMSQDQFMEMVSRRGASGD